MTTPAPAPPPPSPAAAAPARRWRRVALAFAAALALSIAGGAALTLWAWQTHGGLLVTLAALKRLPMLRIDAVAPQGSFADGFSFGRLTIEMDGIDLRIDRLRAGGVALRPRLGGTLLGLHFDELAAERVALRLLPSAEASSGPPKDIGSPVAVEAQRLAVGAFELRSGAADEQREHEGPLLALRAIEARVVLGPWGYAIEDGRLAYGAAGAPLEAQLAGRLASAAPFAVDARGLLRGSVQAQPLQAELTASGSLTDLALSATVHRAASAAAAAADGPPASTPAGPQPRGTLQARIAAFDAPTLRALSADLAGIDPAAWIAGAPQADLTLRAELAPQPAAQFTVAGRVELANAAPGTLDAQRLPLRAASGRIEVSAAGLQATDVVAQLTRGTLRGHFSAEFTDAAPWRAQLQFAGVDPAALHAQLRPFVLDGQASVAHAGGDTAVKGTLRNRSGAPLQASVDLRVNAARLRVDDARVQLGAGQAQFAGELQLAGTRAARFEGSLTDFDPSQLVAGLDARITGSFAVDGALAPQPAGRARFELADSRAFGRPLAGRGELALTADQQLTVDAALSVRSATLSARGSLGAPDSRLALQIDAPQLAELGLPVTGRLVAHAQLAGSWQAPAVEAQVEARALAVAGQRIAELQGSASYAGGSDGALALQLSLSDHRYEGQPLLSLQSAALQVSGRPSAHRIELRGNTAQAQPLAVEIDGGWQRAGADARGQPQPGQWRGTLRSAAAGQPFDLQLLEPAAIVTDFSRWAVGPLALRIAGAQVDQVRVDVDGAAFSTSGRFTGFRPSALRSLDGNGLVISGRGSDGRTGGERTPLTLQGSWQLRLGEQADGQLRIERSGGDLVAGSTPMGISELWLDAQLRANRLQIDARLRGERAGHAQAQLSAYVERADGWRLAPQRPLAGSLQAELTSIAWLNSFAGDAVRGNVRLGGAASAQLQLQGTPAAPAAQGTLAARDLRIAWIDQGIRLRDGTLAAHIEGDALVLDELRFTGPPRVVPADRRPVDALAKAGGAGDAYLSASGRLDLRGQSGVLQVQAVRMPFLQRPDRWVVATGGANIVFDQRRVQLNGAVAADAGFVDFSRSDLPSLSADVQVLRAAETPAARERPVGFAFDLGIDLGSAFYLRGSGLDARIEGQLRLRADERGALRATGTVEAHDGVYEGFGQKLAIARARVNFQGPLENPGLDILAVRRGLPVEVGVTITRSAANPLIRLYSDQSLPDFQILSWLVLGRPADESGQDRAALATAAAGLLSGSGEGVTTQLARALGIDEISLRSGELAASGSLLPRSSVAGNVRGTSSTATSEIVTIGKRLSENVTVSYEQAVSGAAGLVQVSYQLSRRLSLLARAGTENALDLVYSFAFD